MERVRGEADRDRDRPSRECVGDGEIRLIGVVEFIGQIFRRQTGDGDRAGSGCKIAVKRFETLAVFADLMTCQMYFSYHRGTIASCRNETDGLFQ